MYRLDSNIVVKTLLKIKNITDKGVYSGSQIDFESCV